MKDANEQKQNNKSYSYISYLYQKKSLNKKIILKKQKVTHTLVKSTEIRFLRAFGLS